MNVSLRKWKPRLVLTGQSFRTEFAKPGLQRIRVCGEKIAGGMEDVPCFVLGGTAYELRLANG